MKTIVVYLHGMGNSERDFAEKLINKIDDNEIIHQSVWYNSIMQPNENKLKQKYQNSQLDWNPIRNWALDAFSDVTGYLYYKQSFSKIYDLVHNLIRENINQAISKAGGEYRIKIIAHSLGVFVISNYIWDCIRQNNQPEFINNLDCIISTGCNIPVFTGALENYQCFEIQNINFSWLNIYDKDDPLGWPLKPLDLSYEKYVEDVQVNAGSVFASWNPASHICYWEDKDVVKLIKKKIRE